MKTTEIIGSINFTAVRSDRSRFVSNKKSGGGIITLIHKDVDYSIFQQEMRTMLEYNCIRINLGNMCLLLVNVYMPPERTRLNMVKKLRDLLEKYRSKYNTDQIILLGDFNSSGISRDFCEKVPGHLTGSGHNLTAMRRN